MISTLFIVLCILCALDILTTCIALRHDGIHELNPILKPIMEKLGVLPALLLAKGIFLPLVYTFGMNLILLSCLNIIYVAVLINNCYVLYKLYQTRV